MRKVCVNKSKFEKTIGYSSWAIITIIILTFQIASIIEMNNVYSESKIRDTGEIYYTERKCYDSVIFDEPKCSKYISVELRTQERVGFFLVFTITNFIVMVVFIYGKQKKFKFEWCET